MKQAALLSDGIVSLKQAALSNTADLYFAQRRFKTSQ